MMGNLTRPCYQCKHHTKKNEHYCNKYKKYCYLARKFKKEDCFEVDREEIKNKVLGIAKDKFGKDIEEDKPFNGLLAKYEATHFLLEIEQFYSLDREHVFELDDNELANCLTVGCLIGLIVRSL